MAMSSFLREAGLSFDPMQQHETLSDVQSIEERRLTALDIPSPSHPRTASRAMRYHSTDAGYRRAQLDFGRLRFLPLEEWDEYNSYEEDVLSRLRYLIK
jgi:hypothetical protein